MTNGKPAPINRINRMDRYKIERIPIRNEVDRFGFSHLLWRVIHNESSPPKPRVSWVHGWKWYDLDDFRQLGLKSISMKYKTIVVTNNAQKCLLQGFGFKRIHVGGLPFAYALNLRQSLIKLNDCYEDRDTLIVLPKSQPHQKVRDGFQNMIDYVCDNRSIKQRSVFCVFESDLQRSHCKSAIEASGVPFVVGAAIDDANSLSRMVRIYSSFQKVITNTIGSHIPYSLACGASIRFEGPYDVKTPDFFKSDENLCEAFNNDLEKICHLHSIDYLIRRHPVIFSTDAADVEKKKWALDQIGIQNLIPIEDIFEILGWTKRGRIRSMVESIKFRLAECTLRNTSASKN